MTLNSGEMCGFRAYYDRTQRCFQVAGLGGGGAGDEGGDQGEEAGPGLLGFDAGVGAGAFGDGQEGEAVQGEVEVVEAEA